MVNSIPVYQVRSNAILIYQQFQGRRNPALQAFRISNMQLQRSKAYKGTMSKGMIKRMSKSIDLLVQSAKPTWLYNPVTKKNQLHRLSFITLTIPDQPKRPDAKFCVKKLLEPFLQWLRRVKKVTTYIWKAEFQKNGMLHFHITTHSFIPWYDIKDKWNNLLRKNSLTVYHFKKFHNHKPNSTDIHAVHKVNDLAAYFIKYFTKSTQNPKEIDAKIWDCSMNLKKYNRFTGDFSDTMEDRLITKIKNNPDAYYSGDTFKIYRIKNSEILSCLPVRDIPKLHNLLCQIRDYRSPKDEDFVSEADASLQ